MSRQELDSARRGDFITLTAPLQTFAFGWIDEGHGWVMLYRGDGSCYAPAIPWVLKYGTLVRGLIYR